MLDEGMRAGLDWLGIPSRCVLHVEREISVAGILASRMAEGSVEPAPVWSDLRTLDGCAFRGLVDCVSAGIPCQGNSMAGKRLLEDDPRNLWPATRGALRDMGPRLFFLENVPGILVPDRDAGRSAPIARVLGELAEDGWDAEWCVVSAADVGASHRRERVFLLAHAVRERRQQIAGSASGDEGADAGRAEAFDHQLASAGPALADSECAEWRSPSQRGGNGSQGGDGARQAAGRFGIGGEALADSAGIGAASTQQPRRFHAAFAGDDDLADTGGPGLQGREWRGASGERHGQAAPRSVAELCPLPLFAPGPDADWRDILALAPHTAPAVEPGVRVLVDGVTVTLDAARADQLRAGGNGVVALAAAVAFVTLARRLGLFAATQEGGGVAP